MYNNFWCKKYEACRSNAGITAWFRQDQREWKKHLWTKSNPSNNPYSKLISIERARMHQVDWPFAVLEYLNTIKIQYSEILSNVTERGYWKLPPSELMDVRFGRSAFYYLNHFMITSHCQWTEIIMSSPKCTSTECDRL